MASAYHGLLCAVEVAFLVTVITVLGMDIVRMGKEFRRDKEV